MKGIHGGDIYRNQVTIDFSVNVNPLGIPKAVETALYEAVKSCRNYPDITAEELKKAVSEMVSVPKEALLFGNGASELFMGIVHGIHPKRTLIPVPSFYGYEYAAKAADGEIIYYKTKEDHNFCLTNDFFSVLTENVDLVFLANPNNPTGNLINREYLKNLLHHCKDRGIYVVLDECFIEFCGKEWSMIQEINAFPNLILVRAFTKIFSIPGVRLGYMVCSNQSLLTRISRHLPEWNLSNFAQEAGYVCASQSAFIKESAVYIQKERQFLTEKLKLLGFKVFPGNANFLLIYSNELLYDRLLEKGLLIRNCENFRGLSNGFYRIAVKSRRENEALLKAIGEIKWRK